MFQEFQNFKVAPTLYFHFIVSSIGVLHYKLHSNHSREALTTASGCQIGVSTNSSKYYVVTKNISPLLMIVLSTSLSVMILFRRQVLTLQ